MTTGFVLAGGGVAGVAWEIGVLRGLQDVDPELAASIAAADVTIGTSAGSVVAAQLGGGTPIEELYERQLAPASTELDVQVDMPALVTKFAEAAQGAATRQEMLKRIGELGASTPTAATAAERRAVIAARLPVSTWPDRDLRITAVDIDAGELVVFTRDSGVELVDAVAASCAVPGVWPIVTINGTRHMDGGIRSSSNADLAEGCDKVLVITPQPQDAPLPFNRLIGELEQLRPAEVRVVYGDEASREAFGTNPLSVATRRPSALAGRALGRREADAIAKFWR